MPKVVSIRFHGAGKAYHFDPVDFELHQGDAVIVETVQGVELGIVADEIIEIPQDKLAAPLKPVLRPADDQDLAHYEENRQKESEAYKIASEKIEARGLDMHLVDVEYTFDNRKVVFYFTADGRVDFRELVKDLAAIFRIRIELRQIGVRDEARKIGGVGICGRELCCCSFLNDFVPVSIKMAKEQSLSMNPAKISGICGRLMCCLKYEQDAYEDAHSRLPRNGALVNTPEGPGIVISVNLLKETVTTRLDRGGENDVVVYPYDQLEVTGGRGNNRKCPPGGCPGHSRPDKTRQPAPKLSNAEKDEAWPMLDSDGRTLSADEIDNDNLYRMEEPDSCAIASAEPADQQDDKPVGFEKKPAKRRDNNNNRRRRKPTNNSDQQRSGQNANRKKDSASSDRQNKPENGSTPSNQTKGRRRPNRRPGSRPNRDNRSREGGQNRPVERPQQ
ncbi:MAG: hypothetical protein PWP10_2439 [Clostridiales bacterium]|jgi:cell fate regulator YaaT (PSP1 superfamily)|nr:stage 0 sporulation family protein [Eubacteriales bacterium]MDD3196690.1 stage 0 sporulation family protein [Eubacteriales bacterium]MDD4681946.1 stage 0 sporulation family protein [Eubacteriales bacterium]MDN5313693.1 hypothetical protein [Clostridiales bacterium]